MLKTWVHELKAGDSLWIDGHKVVVTLEHKTGQRARLKVEADDSVNIERRTAQNEANLARSGLMYQP